MSIKVYKIRKKGTTDLFSSGGRRPCWKPKGKTWTQLGHLTAHIGLLSSTALPPIYQDAEVVEFEIMEVRTQDASDVFQGIQERREKQARKRQEAVQKFNRESELRELRRLQAKYPNA